MHSGGKTIHLQAGHYEAKIVTVGAGLAELMHHGRHIVIPHKPEEMPLAHLGKVLVPWPNRVADGCYQHNGKTFQLAVNDPISHTAIHGLLAWRDWQINQQSASEVSLMIFLPPSYGYPFALIAPYGAGAHPYLTCNLHPIDDCELTLPTSEETCSERDFTTPRIIAQTTIDHTFRTLPPDAEWEVRITSQSQNMSTFLRSHQPWLQIYTGEKLARRGLAVEPMTCPPDAFNSGINLIHLAPGEAHQMHFLIGSE